MVNIFNCFVRWTRCYKMCEISQLDQCGTNKIEIYFQSKAPTPTSNHSMNFQFQTSLCLLTLCDFVSPAPNPLPSPLGLAQTRGQVLKQNAQFHPHSQITNPIPPKPTSTTPLLLANFVFKHFMYFKKFLWIFTRNWLIKDFFFSF